jgi:hypothetical protein
MQQIRKLEQRTAAPAMRLFVCVFRSGYQRLLKVLTECSLDHVVLERDRVVR